MPVIVCLSQQLKKKIPSWSFFAAANTLSQRNLNKFNGLIVFKVHLVHSSFHKADFFSDPGKLEDCRNVKG